MNFELSTNSYVIAEDSGLYADRRHPATLGLNYNIQDVKFTTTVSPNATSKSANMISGDMTIVEPYGVTLIDTLVAASYDYANKSGVFTNWVLHPYMLELNFHGYDSEGNQVPKADMAIHRKRFPINIATIKVDVNSSGSTYRLHILNAGATGNLQEYACTPKPITVVAGSVGEFFGNSPGSFTSQLNAHYLTTLSKGAEFADSYAFDIDVDIALSPIIEIKDTNIMCANPNVVSGIPSSGTPGVGVKSGQDFSRTSFTIAAGAAIVDIITRVIAQSKYITEGQLNVGTAQTPVAENTIFKSFRTLVSAEYLGDALTNNVAFDKARAQYPKKHTYKIHKYATWSAPHPAQPQLANSVPYNCKQYDYLFTGKNTDILDLKLNIDATYFTQVLAWPAGTAATLAASGAVGYEDFENSPIGDEVSAAVLLRVNAAAPWLTNPTPLRSKPVVNLPGLTNAMGIQGNPASQIAMNALDSLYTSSKGNMLNTKITIVGDPTLIKQDDWLYVPSPTKSAIYNNWGSIAQDEFIRTYGHHRMDVAEIPILLNIRTSYDIDTEQTNRGLSWAGPGNTTSSTLFSGQYTILRIVNIFAKGVFTQELELARITNNTYATALADTAAASAVRQSQSNQTATGSANR